MIWTVKNERQKEFKDECCCEDANSDEECCSLFAEVLSTDLISLNI